MKKPAWSEKFGEKLRIWRENPVIFVQEALGVETIASWQRETLEAIATNNRLAVKSGHGVGKTALVAWLILWWELTHLPNKVAVTANRQDQLSDVVWAEIRLWSKKLHPALKNLLEITSDKVTWKADPDLGFAVARTARKEAPEAFQGFHSKHMLFLADEASGIDDVIFEVGQGAMSTPGAKTLLTGNPTRTSGYFRDAFKERGNWWTRTVSSLEVIEEGLPYANPDYPQEVAQEYGIDSNVYRYRVLGEFAVEDDDAVISRLLVEASVNRDVEATGRVVWGLDVARFGDDRSALIKRHGNFLREPPLWWKGKDVVQTAGKVVEQFENEKKVLRPDVIMVDAIGIGAGVADRLREAGLPVRDVNVGEVASSKDEFTRLRDELWWSARKWFERKDCRLPENCEQLIDELTDVRYEYTPSRKIKVESKEDVKKRLGRGQWGGKSPDLADAFILTFAAHGVRASKWKKRIDWNRYQPEGYFV